MQACKKKIKIKIKIKENRVKCKLIFSHFIIYWDNIWQGITVATKKLHYFVRFLFKGINVLFAEELMYRGGIVYRILPSSINEIS
jgi:hypothetical protein